MKRPLEKFRFGLLVLFLLVSFLLIHRAKSNFLKEKDEEKDVVGKEAADFSLKDLKGTTVKLSDNKGKVVILNFFATWCSPCVMELPQFDIAEETLQQENIVLFLVSSEPKEVLERFMKEKGYNFTVLMDENDSVSNLYGVNAIPRTIMIGEDGKIIYSKTGAIRSVFNDILSHLPSKNSINKKESYQKVDDVLKLVKCDCKCGLNLSECRCANCPQRKNLNEIREYVRKLVLEDSFSNEQMAKIVEWKYCGKGDKTKKEGGIVEGEVN